jgi:hypothetical protein
LGDWRLNYIFQARTGQPFNLNVGGDPANISGSIGGISGYARPNLISDPFTAGPVPSNPNPRCNYTLSQIIPDGQPGEGQTGLAADAVRTATSWFNQCAFAAPSGSFGNFGRNVLRSAPVYNVDLAVHRTIRFGERKKLELRAEAFNVFNLNNLAVPSVTTISLPNPDAACSGVLPRPAKCVATLGASNGAGSITSIIGNPRQIQFAARFEF